MAHFTRKTVQGWELSRTIYHLGRNPK